MIIRTFKNGSPHSITLRGSFDILTKEEFFYLKRYNNFLSVLKFDAPWWLKNSPGTSITYYISENAELKYDDITKIKAIRPVFKFDVLNNNHLTIGDEFLICDGTVLFKYVGHYNNKGYALCEAAITYSPFDKKDISQYYKDTILNKTLSAWVNNVVGSNSLDNISLSISPITILNLYNNIIPVKAGLPTMSEIHKFSFQERKRGFPYWLFGRGSEFTAFSVDKEGHLIQTDIMDKNMNIYPTILFNDAFPFFSSTFIINGYVFCKVSEDKCISLNSIGTSRYSTGIENIDNGSETDFFNSSEVKEEIEGWFLAMKTKYSV